MARLVESFGDCTATIEVLPPGKASLYWYNANGKELKNLPKSVRERYQSQYSDLKIKFKNIQETLRIQTKRIELFFLEGFKTEFNEWWRYYVEHPLIGSISRGLIWNFENDSDVYSAIIKDQKLVMADGSLLSGLSDNAIVSLWHPLLSHAETRDAWRSYVWINRIIQPFRQAFREIYLKIPGSDNQLFIKGLYVRQHQFRALLIAKGWSYQFRGRFLSESCPRFRLKSGIDCEIGISGQGDIYSAASISLVIELEEVRFLYNNKLLDPSEIDPIEYSEVMRDIDLFVSVSALGYKKDWDQIEATFADVKNSSLMEDMARLNQPASIIGNDMMLENNSLADAISELFLALEVSMKKLPIPETVKTRACLLELMLSESKISHLIRFEGRYVHLDAANGSYRINMASGLVFNAMDNTVLPIATQQMTINTEAVNDTLLSRIYGLILMLAKE